MKVLLLSPINFFREIDFTKKKVHQRDDNTWWLWDLWTFLEVFGGWLEDATDDDDDVVEVELLLDTVLDVFDDGFIRPEVEWPFLSLLFWRINEWSTSIPSSSPSPVTAHVGCRCHKAPGPNSFRPKAASNLVSSKAEGKSCLLAKTSTGMCPALLLLLQIFNNSNLASSNLSSLVESTTKIIPSVHRVYDLHNGLNFSWPPTSQTA